MHQWLVKTEPEAYSIDNLEADRTSEWDGVRNALAQQYMRQMELDDSVLIYHSGKEKAIVGLAKVAREKYLDPTDTKGKAVCVDLKHVETFDHAVPLSEVKANAKLKKMALVRISRLSVMPVSRAHWKVLMGLAGHE